MVRDSFSRRVVGWSIDAAPTAALVTNALGMAIDRRIPPAGGIVHSDSEYVGAGCSWLPDPHSDGHARIRGAGRSPSLLTRTSD